MDAGQRHGAGVGAELLTTVGGGEPNDFHPGGARRLDSGGRIFDHQTFGWHHTETGGGEQVNVGAWLSSQHIFGTDEHTGRRQTRTLKTPGSDGASSRSRYCPALAGQGFQQPCGTVNRPESLGTRVLLIGSEGRYLRLGIKVRSRQTNGLDRPTAVTHAEEGLDGQTPGNRPSAPLLFYVSDRVDQNTIEIEDDGATLKAFHG